jgi:predicted phosphodiesterase
VPDAQGQVGPSQMTLGVSAGTRETSLRLPPLGRVSAHTHKVPMSLDLALVEIEVEPLARAVTTDAGRDELRNEVEKDLLSLAIKAAVQFSLALALIAAGVAALVLGRHLLPLLVAPASALLVLGVSSGIAIATFDVSAFEQPSFSGSLTKAREVVDAVGRSEEVLDEARSRFDVATERLTDLFELLARPDLDPRTADTVILHISDIHANPIGFEIAAQLTEQFGVDAVIDTGDLASSILDTGSISTVIDPVDQMIAREIAELDVPYIYVPGNHDSPELRARVALVDSVVELDGTTAEAGNLEVLGWADPTFSVTPVPEEEKQSERLEQADDVLVAVEDELPDILAVHDSVLAAESLGAVPLVLAGHTHEQGELLEEGTLVLTVGSTGATGLKSLTIEAGRQYEAQILYFQANELVSVDYVSFQDIGGDFQLTRRTYAHPLD